MNQITTFRWSLEQEVEHLKQCGYDAIGLWRQKVTKHGVEKSAELIRETELGVSTLSFVGGFTGANGLGRDEALADGRDAILEAEMLDADTVVVVTGPRNTHTKLHCRRLIVDSIRELADFAGSRSIKLAVLPMHTYFSSQWTHLNTIDAALDVISAVNRKCVTLAFDAYQMWNEPRLMHRIPDFAPMTSVVQISDAIRAPHAVAERRIPGEGIIPLEGIIRAFQQAGFDGYYDLQIWSSLLWAGDYADIIYRSREAMLNLDSEACTLI